MATVTARVTLPPGLMISNEVAVKTAEAFPGIPMKHGGSEIGKVLSASWDEDTQSWILEAELTGPLPIETGSLSIGDK